MRIVQFVQIESEEMKITHLEIFEYIHNYVYFTCICVVFDYALSPIEKGNTQWVFQTWKSRNNSV